MFPEHHQGVTLEGGRSSSLVVQHSRGGLALELLLVQDALEVLHALLRVLHVCGQVAVQEADGVAEHGHAGTHTPFVSLWGGR